MQLDPDLLLERARQLTGLDDFGPDDFHEPFAIFVRALNDEAQIAPDKVGKLEERLQRLLANRLWFANDVANHPEILDEDLGSPIVITSLPRTGSTKLHRLLAASGDFNVLNFWQVHMPSRIPGEPDGGAALRRQRTQEHEAWMYREAPEIMAGHPMFTDEAEECQWMMEQSFRHPILFGSFEVPTYLGWLMSADQSLAFDYYRQQLQYLQWQRGGRQGKPWLIKSPTHFGMEPLLEQALGPIRAIATHRDPAKCIPSITSASIAVRKLYSDGDYSTGLVDGLAQLFSTTSALHLAWREQTSPDVLDLSFKQVSRDSVGATEAVYDFLGMPLSDASRAAIAAWEADEERNKHEKAAYSAEGYGTTEEALRAPFETYLTTFREYI